MPKTPSEDPALGTVIFDRWRLVERLEGGVSAPVYRAFDEHMDNRQVALKIIVVDANKPDGYWKEEWQHVKDLSVKLSQVAIVFDSAEGLSPYGDDNVYIGCIATEYVEGWTLGQYLDEHPDRLTSDLVYPLIESVCEAIAAFQSREVEHGDLHWNNIMVRKPEEYWGNPNELRFCIIDFGLSREIRGRQSHGDLMKFGFATLERLLETLEASTCTADKGLADFLSKASKLITDEDTSMRCSDPKQLRAYAQEWYTPVSAGAQREERLSHPFAYANQEEVPLDSPLTCRLIYRNVGWYDKLNDWGSCFLIGPRGCGKSLLLLDLRLRTHIAGHNLDDDDIPFNARDYVGFYLQCNQAVYSPLSILVDTIASRDTSRAIIHYINMQFLKEIVETLSLMDEIPGFELDGVPKRALLAFVGENVQEGFSPLPRVDALQQASHILHRELLTVREALLGEGDLRTISSIEFYRDVCTLLARVIPQFTGKRFVFLLDDYRHPTVGFNIQQVYNSVLRDRNPVYCFKIATEPFAWTTECRDGTHLDEEREYHVIDIGQRYYALGERGEDRKHIVTFIQAVVDKRMALAGLEDVSSDSMLGPKKISWEEWTKDAAAFLRNGPATQGESEPPERIERPQYAGMEIIHSLCSADLTHFLRLCRKITDAATTAGIEWKRGDRIPDEVQDEVVRDYSKEQLVALQYRQEVGRRLYDIAHCFGELSQEYLRHDFYRGDNRLSPGQAIRIEIDDAADVPNNLEDLYHELFRATVFINVGLGYPRGQTLTSKLMFRKIYCPAFNLPCADRDPHRMSTNQFCRMLAAPRDWLKRQKLGVGSHAKVSRDRTKGIRQLPLGEEDGPDDDSRDA